MLRRFRRTPKRRTWIYDTGSRPEAFRHFLERAGCGAVVMGLFGSGAGAIWSTALGFGPGVGALYGAISMAVLGFVLVPFGVQAHETRELGFPPALIYFGLLLFAILIGFLMWIARAIGGH